MVLSTESKHIKYLSYVYHGSQHDYEILKTELPAANGLWFSQHAVHLDLAYKGIDKLYDIKQLCIPFKKPRKSTLTAQQKAINKELSAIRVTVENAIAGLKRYRFLADRLRCRNIDFYNKVIGICAGLWNFNLTH